MAQRNYALVLSCCFSVALCSFGTGEPLSGQESAPGPTASRADAARQRPKDQTAPVILRHRIAGADSWSIVETRNFRILHYHPRAVAEKCPHLAEQRARPR